MPLAEDSRMAEKETDKTLEMRVAELEDKLKGMQVTEDEMRAYNKVASMMAAAPPTATAATAELTPHPDACIIQQCIRPCVVQQCTIRACTIRACTVVSQCTVVQQCTIVQQCIRACTIIQDCINECGGGCAPGGGGFGGAGGFGGLGG